MISQLCSPTRTLSGIFWASLLLSSKICQAAYLVFLPALRHQRIIHGWGLERWISYYHSALHEREIASLHDKEQPDRDSMCFYWTKLNWWDKETDASFCLSAPWHLVHFLWPSLVDSLSQICPRSKHSGESGRPVSVTPGPQKPRDARFIWDQHGDHLSPGSAELNWSPWGSCQHWDRLSVGTPAGLALFFCQPWIARSLKLLVFFQLKSNKCLEENNPIWKPVGNWVDRFPDFAKMHRS